MCIRYANTLWNVFICPYLPLNRNEKRDKMPIGIDKNIVRETSIFFCIVWVCTNKFTPTLHLWKQFCNKETTGNGIIFTHWFCLAGCYQIGRQCKMGKTLVIMEIQTCSMLFPQNNLSSQGLMVDSDELHQFPSQ